ncbi:MAG: DnaD domain protein [Limosilactobacillus sp.]|uniref:DnaD domain-containing protein n=1 Tax=Limosilactobacillus sp. TaxID=2773925 RepID=UPI002709BE3D|nr:DnaD domain protein [Limosilactobacillus sp.]
MADNVLQRYLAAGQTVIDNNLLYHYKDLGMTTSQFVMYLQFKSYQDRGNASPDIRQIAKNLETSEVHVFEQLHHMITAGLVVQQMTKLNGKEEAVYDFTPLLNRLLLLLDQEEAGVEESTEANDRMKTFNNLEAEFGRPLSSMEMQIVNDWLDKDNYTPVMIKLALREAVLNSAINLNYMERILQSWDRQGLRTQRDIEERERQFEQRKSGDQRRISNNSKKKTNGPQIPIYKLGE